MIFSIKAKPPLITEIMNEEAELKRKIKPIKYLPNIFLVAAFIIFISGVVVILFAPYGGLINVVFGFAVFATSFLAAFVSLVFARRIDIINKSINELSDIPISNCEEALRICGISSECEGYRQNVVRQGRKLAYGELVMMRDSVPAGSKSYEEARERRLQWACTKLHS